MLTLEQVSLDEESGDMISNADVNSNVHEKSVDDEDTIPPAIIVTNENGRKIENKRSQTLKIPPLKRGEYRMTYSNAYSNFALLSLTFTKNFYFLK